MRPRGYPDIRRNAGRCYEKFGSSSKSQSGCGSFSQIPCLFFSSPTPLGFRGVHFCIFCVYARCLAPLFLSVLPAPLADILSVYHYTQSRRGNQVAVSFLGLLDVQFLPWHVNQQAERVEWQPCLLGKCG